MASLALGAIGGFFFGPIGFMVGSAIGSLLFPEKREGPRLANLKLQSSEYGRMIPIPYGTVRVPGMVIWQTDLVEHRHRSGGKGGPQVTTYSYTASFACELCEGPIAGVLRIWADGTLIYDTTAGATIDNSSVPVTFYLGTETQLPDPTMEAELGVGNVPAYRGLALAVFADWDMGDFGNRLPNLNFEVFTSGGDIPVRISSWSPPVDSASGSMNGQSVGCATIDAGVITYGVYEELDSFGATGQQYTEYTFDLDGTQLSSVTTGVPQIPDNGFGNAHMFMIPCANAQIGFGLLSQQGQNNTQASAWFVGAGMVAYPVNNIGSSPRSHDCVMPGSLPYLFEEYLYVCGSTSSTSLASHIARYPAPAGIPAGSPDVFYTLPSSGTWQVTCDNDGNVYAMGPSGPNVKLLEFDPDLNLVHQWAAVDLPSSLVSANLYSFTVWNGILCTADAAANVAHAFTIDGGYSITEVGSIAIASTTSPRLGRPTIPLGSNGLVLTEDGIISLNPPSTGVTLASIVSDVSTRSGLSVAQIDVAQLTDNVAGYLLTNQADGRADILPLQSAYYFDGVESSGVMKFVKRGGTIAATLSDDDIAAYVYGDAAPDLLAPKRVQEVDLPATVNVTYADIDLDHQSNSQQARRQVTYSQAVSEIQLPIVMDKEKARQVAYVLLFGSWLERTSYTITTSRKYLYLEPTDVISAHGRVMRVVRKTESAPGVVTLEAVESNAGLYLAAPAGNPAQGITSVTPSTRQATDLLLLDIPLTSDAQDEMSIRSAMAGAVDDTWRGATLFRSTDSGATYTEVLGDSVADAFGVTLDALPDFQGGNTFDEASVVTVQLDAGADDLASADEDAVLSGANIAVVGNELIQFKVATLYVGSPASERTYALSGLLRGRFGTEWAMPSHAAGEAFCLLPVDDVPGTLADLGQERLYKPVTFGSTLAATAAQTFTNNGAALRPYAPVHVAGGPITPFDGIVQVNWTRRTRTGGVWSDYVDVPLGEATEGYVVQVWNSTYTQCARIIETTAQTTTYTAAQQVADFGATQAHVYVTVGQKGLYKLGTQTPAVIPGLGASDGNVLVPIDPYNSAPPPPTGGCALPVTSSSFDWNAPVSQYNPAAGPTGTWVISFTTGAAVAGAGRIDAAEYAGPAVRRHMTLATSPCGTALGLESVGNTVSIIFYMIGNPFPTIYPTLLPSTTYYISINSDSASGMICNLSTPH